MQVSHPPRAEIAKRVGITDRQLHTWILRGYFKLENPARGSGFRDVWTDSDIERLQAMADRVKWGMTLEAASRTEDPPLPAPPKEI